MTMTLQDRGRAVRVSGGLRAPEQCLVTRMRGHDRALRAASSSQKTNAQDDGDDDEQEDDDLASVDPEHAIKLGHRSPA